MRALQEIAWWSTTLAVYVGIITAMLAPIATEVRLMLLPLWLIAFHVMNQSYLTEKARRDVIVQDIIAKHHKNREENKQ